MGLPQAGVDPHLPPSGWLATLLCWLAPCAGLPPAAV